MEGHGDVQHHYRFPFVRPEVVRRPGWNVEGIARSEVSHLVGKSGLTRAAQDYTELRDGMGVGRKCGPRLHPVERQGRAVRLNQPTDADPANELDPRSRRFVSDRRPCPAHGNIVARSLQSLCGERGRFVLRQLYWLSASRVRMNARPRRRRPRRLTIVLAKWCPHCVPLSLRESRRLARRLRVPLHVLDIDRPAEIRSADRIVRDHGDNAPDYLIPQVFLEWTDGSVQHFLTGFSEEVARTERAWRDLFASDWLRAVAQEIGR